MTTKSLHEQVEDLEFKNSYKDKTISNLENKIEDLESEIWGRESDIEELEERIEESTIYPRNEVTLPELMKFEYIKNNWDRIKLEDLEGLYGL